MTPPGISGERPLGAYFEDGIDRTTGDPNHGYKQPLRVRFLFEEIDTGGIDEQMAWLSDAIVTDSKLLLEGDVYSRRD